MKKILMALLVLVSALVLVACGEEQHTHAWNEGEVTKEATCVAAGEMTYSCECGETKVEAIEKTAHAEYDKDATDHWCTVCEEKAAHTWDEGKVTVVATCSKAGATKYTCTVCGKTKVETSEKLAHTFDRVDWDEENHWKECACTAVDPDVEPEAHELAAGVKDEVAGTMSYACECGYALVHELDEEGNPVHVFAAKYENGYKVETCACGEVVQTPHLTYVGTHTGHAEAKGDLFVADLDLSKAWNRVEFTYAGEKVSTTNTAISGSFVNTAAAPWTLELYTEDGSMLLVSVAGGYYVCEYDPEAKTLFIGVKGLSYGGEYYNGSAAYDAETDSYSFDLVIGQWKYITLAVHGKAVDFANATITGMYGSYNDVAAASSEKYQGLYLAENGLMSAIGGLYKVTYNCADDSLNIAVIKEDGLWLYGTWNGTQQKVLVEPQEDGSYAFEITYASAWKNVSFLYNGQLIRKSGLGSIDVEGTQYIYFDSSHNYRVYINANSIDAESKFAPVTYVVTFNPETLAVKFAHKVAE